MNSSDTPSGARRPLQRRLTAAFRLAGVIVVAALVSGPLFAQKIDAGVPEDWSHHHVVFSAPHSLGHHVQLLSNPRYVQQLTRRNSHNQGDPDGWRWRRAPEPGTNLDPTKRDWSATLGGAGVAPDMFPAKYQFSPTATPTCTDYIIFPVNKAGVLGSQPNLVAYQNLYVNAGGTGVCAGTTPTVLFSYFVGTGTVQTSPALGGSSGQVAYVESAAGASKFHILQGAGTGASNGTIAAPVAPGTGNTANDVSITLNGAVNVTRSSPFYDFAADVAYVGDDSGKLHKFTGVFKGVPAEVVSGVTAGCTAPACVWPAVVSTQVSNILTPPVFDDGSLRVYVGDSQGFLYSVSSSNGSGTSGGVTQSGQLGNSASGIVDSPLLDPSVGGLYVFVGNNVSGTNSAVFAFSLSTGNIIGGSSGTSVTLGAGGNAVPVYDGTFDNIYYSSATGVGSLYVCGNAGGNPTLYRVPITAGQTLGAVVTGPALASGNVGCSPLTEFNNTTTSVDWLFAGVPANSCGAAAGTAGGCVLSFNITSALTAANWFGPWVPSTFFALNSEIVDTAGNLQKCTGVTCGAGGESGTTTPAWTLTTTTEGTSANASSIGTVSANSAVSGATVTIGTLTLTASAPTYASSPILINSEPPGPSTITINGTVYDWRTTAANCTAGENCIARSATLTTDATNLFNAINGTSCYNPTGCVQADPTVTATVSGTTVTVTAITAGTGANSDVLAASNTASIHINGAANASTTLGAGTGTLGTNGSNTAPNFQYWSGASAVITAVLASNIAAAITPAEQTAAGIALSYTASKSFLTITGAGANTGVAGNSVAVGGTLTGFSWNPSGHLGGGSSPITWAYQSASNGQTSAPEATGTSGIAIDNLGAGAGEASVYFGTLAGTGATNSGVKMTQAGLQ